MQVFKVKITGNLIKDAEKRFTKDGKDFITFKLGTSNGWGDNKKDYFPQVTLWGQMAKHPWVLEGLYKGREVSVEGDLTVQMWESDGKSGVNINVSVYDINLHGKGVNTPSEYEESSQGEEDDDIPF